MNRFTRDAKCRRLRRAFRRNFEEFKKTGCLAAKGNVVIIAQRLRDLDAMRFSPRPGLAILRVWFPFAFVLTLWICAVFGVFGFLAGIFTA